MTKSVLVLLADGFEEIEAVTAIDVLRRAGLKVLTVGVGKKEITGAHNIHVMADVELENTSEIPDAVVLPGGMPGAANLKKSPAVTQLLQKMKNSGKLIAAICASPAVVLSPQGILDGKKATCYPGFENDFSAKVKVSQDRVVRDGLVTTSRGPGSALEFSIELVSQLVDKDTSQKLAKGMLLKA